MKRCAAGAFVGEWRWESECTIGAWMASQGDRELSSLFGRRTMSSSLLNVAVILVSRGPFYVQATDDLHSWCSCAMAIMARDRCCGLCRARGGRPGRALVVGSDRVGGGDWGGVAKGGRE